MWGKGCPNGHTGNLPFAGSADSLDGLQKNLLVIGDPIEHSLSPKIHSFVMEQLGVPYTYQSVQVKKGELAPFIDRVRSENIDGFNVTMPHKVDIIEYLDWIDAEAEYFNSVNTVKNDNGRLCGYSTDGEGFVRSMADVGVTPCDKKILFLGAGGVVNTLAQKLAMSGARKIVILNRTVETASNICDILSDRFSINCEFADLEFATIGEKIKTADIVINATPLGMVGVSNDWESCEFLKSAPGHALIADLIYNPRMTKLLSSGKKLGLKTLDGLGMLIYQALLADEVYLGRTFKFSEIARTLEGTL
ncbi:MAG: shikimate dehydrogenase [Oscillospiraceae bacterium]|nr:shikimate dehydrogenase [Oscillospiraceae bacterium]